MQYRHKQILLLNQNQFGKAAWPDNEWFIFCDHTGKATEPRAFTKRFKALCAQAGFCDPSITFHTLRHTFATRAIESGMDIKVISSLLGHADVSTTLNMYGHALPTHKKESMDKMEVFYYSDEKHTQDGVVLANGWKII